jgi:hypothetical protein
MQIARMSQNDPSRTLAQAIIAATMVSGQPAPVYPRFMLVETESSTPIARQAAAWIVSKRIPSALKCCGQAAEQLIFWLRLHAIKVIDDGQAD